MKKLYRFNTNNSNSFTSVKRYSYGDTVIMLDIFDVIKETPCGSWIELIGVKKFVNHNCVKQFAYKTEEEALISFVARKKRQISILKSQLREAENSLIAIGHEPISLPDKSIGFKFDHILKSHY